MNSEHEAARDAHIRTGPEVSSAAATSTDTSRVSNTEIKRGTARVSSSSVKAASAKLLPSAEKLSSAEAASLREQMRYAMRMYSTQYANAWGGVIAAGVCLYGLGWYLKGEDPLAAFKREEKKEGETKGRRSGEEA